MSGIWLVALLSGLMFVPYLDGTDDEEETDQEEPSSPVDPLVPADTVEGTDGDDTLTATGSQTVNAGAGNDILIADEEASGAVLNGDAGADTLTEGGENVTLNGGIGNDVFNGGEAVGTVMNGGEGVDIFQLDGAGGVVVNADAGDDEIYTLVDSQDMIINGGGGEDVMTLGGIGAIVHGDNGNDVINVQGAAAEVYGDSGNDTINVSHGERGSAVQVSGGDGDDVIILRDTRLDGAMGSTAASGDAGNDRFDVEVMLGSNSSGTEDILTGGADADSFELYFVDQDGTSGGDLGVVSRITDFTLGEDALIIDASDLGVYGEEGEERTLDGFNITEENGNTLITLDFSGPDAGDTGSAIVQLDGVTGLSADDITILS